MLDRFEFLLMEALIGMRRNTLMTFAAITTVAVSLFILGGLGYSYLKLSEFARTLPPQLDSRVYLKESATPEDVKEVLGKVRALPGVREAVWIPRDTSWEKFKRDNPDAERSYDEIENPFPEALKIIWEDLERAPSAAATIRMMPSVEKVDAPENAQKVVAQAMALVRGIGIGLGGILFLTGGVLIYNAIRLTIISRRREIRIMQLVGASRGAIQTPFVIEGIIQGILGGVLAFLIMIATWAALAKFVEEIGLPVTMPPLAPWSALGLLCAAGAAYGLICSLMAVREPTRFR